MESSITDHLPDVPSTPPHLRVQPSGPGVRIVYDLFNPIGMTPSSLPHG